MTGERTIRAWRNLRFRKILLSSINGRRNSVILVFDVGSTGVKYGTADELGNFLAQGV
ncbi:MAG: hypothetical protein ACLTC4_13520 [Hungatella hathewayi]